MLTDIRVLAVELLRAFKHIYRYRELEQITGLPAPALWRYINHRIMPSEERARELIEKLVREPIIEDIIKKRALYVKWHNIRLVNLNQIVYDVSLLKIFSYIAYRRFMKYNINAVMTVEIDGIPVGVSIADILDSKLVVARRRPDIGIRYYYQTQFFVTDPPGVVNLYVPKMSLSPSDRVLLVDDVIISGKTLLALNNIVQQTGATTVGVFAMAAIGEDGIRELKKEITENVFVVKVFPKE